jgi:hypothetical protein
VFSALDPLGQSGRLTAGAVVGAVQSGKTRLMINLAARAFDCGFRIVVVLGGLKDDLRAQTALRFTQELLLRGDPVPGVAGAYTHPAGPGCHGARADCWSPRFYDDVHDDEAFIHLFCASLLENNQVLAVAKKNVAALNRLRAAYEYATSKAATVPLPLLVLDDECDEASVGGEPEAPTPERIAQLWNGLGHNVAYIGVTATPAANLLQDTEALLYPRDFLVTLRTPGEGDSGLTYLEPEPHMRYTGGDTFYEALERRQRDNFLVRTRMSDAEFDGMPGSDEELAQALTAYFVAGGIRWLQQPGTAFDDPQKLPKPHTMLAHTESRVESHWELCNRVVGLVREKGGRSSEITRNMRTVAPQARLAAEDLERWLASNPHSWRWWYEHYRDSHDELSQAMPDRLVPELPSWGEVVASLSGVFRAVKLRVLNSDESSVDGALRFHPSYSSHSVRPPTDVYSIIIGGNRLSRGLTIEGLCTSYYTRSSIQLLEDTTLQRERWFGYRGTHLEFCRVFTHRDLAVQLRRFHEHDEDVRRQLVWHVEHGLSPANATYRFLTLRSSRPTGKLGRGVGPQEIDISGSRPFVDRVQMGINSLELEVARANQDHAASVASRIVEQGEPLAGDSGMVLRGWSAADIADIVDTFAYTFHNPDPSRGVPWNLRDHHRRAASWIPTTASGLSPKGDPFLIAAYLRFWQDAYEQCMQDPSSNTFRAADSVSEWEPCPAPMLNLAVRFGSLAPRPESPFAFNLLNRAVDRFGVVGSRWGGRGYGSPGDEWIDEPPPGEDLEAPRPPGMPGLALLHVIGRDAHGRDRNGSCYDFDRPCLGFVVPAGGPCIRFVLAEAAP